MRSTSRAGFGPDNEIKQLRRAAGHARSSRTNWVWSPSSPRHGLLLGGYADGRRSTLDLLSWEPWADVAEPLAVLRERYNITATPV